MTDSPSILAAFLLGLAGSFGHCVGMCTGVLLLLGGREGGPWRQVPLHVGRIMSYGLLGMLVGGAGGLPGMGTGSQHHHEQLQVSTGSSMSQLGLLQGGLALLAAAVALYMSLALLGYVPGPERLLVGLTRHWGRAIRQTARPTGLGQRFMAGMLWGLLPCGMVLAALLAALASHSVSGGLLTMLAFGIGTLPALLATGWLAQRPMFSWPRRLAAGLVLLVGLQLCLRGLAAWGVVEHLSVGKMMVW